jgi:integrase
LTEVTRQTLDHYTRVSGRKPGQCLFQGRLGPEQHLTTRQYARLVGEWVSSIGLDPLKYATHSMRRTKATLIYRRTGNLRAVQLLLGHTKIESTVRYLSLEIDDALDIAEKNRRLKYPGRAALFCPAFDGERVPILLQKWVAAVREA